MEGITPLSRLMQKRRRGAAGGLTGGEANGHKKTRLPKLKQDLLRFSRISYAPAS
jgi:hypothetical protein